MSIRPDDVLSEFIATVGDAIAGTDDASISEYAQCLLLLSDDGALDPSPFPQYEGALVCSLGTDEKDDGELRVGYDPQRHDPRWIAAVTKHFRRLIEALPATHALNQIDWLDPLEREQILYKWNAAVKDYPYDQCLHWLFARQARRTPDTVAAEFDETTITYAELDARSTRLAHRLLRLGACRGSFIPLCAERSLDLLVGVLAILKTGAAYVPVDPRFPAAHTRQVLEDCEPQLVLAQRRFVERFETSAATIVALEEPCDDNGEIGETGHPHDTATVMYTSGSTGTPKGTLISHRSLVNNILWLQDNWPLGADDRMLQKTPFTFDVSIKELLWPLAVGARVVFARPGGHLDMRYLSRLIAERGATITHFVPSMLQRFLDMPGSERCRSLKLIMCGAEILSPRLKERVFKQLDAKLLHLYGPTEAAISVTGWECEPGAENEAVVPLGRPMENVQLYLLDRAGQPVPPAVPGEIYIGGVAVAGGYLKRPELNRERFVRDRFTRQVGAGRLYRTGDLARFRDDGVIEFIGRIDQQIKIRGARVEPREIEIALNEHPELKCAAVRAQTDRFGDVRLIAYVVAEGPSRPSAWSLRQYCVTRLPIFMVPSAFVVLDEMPLLPNGKIDHAMLPRLEAR